MNNSNESQTQKPVATSQTEFTYKTGIAQGWECPRCGRINAPWVSQCNCTCDNWTITTSNWIDKPEQWKEITCNSDTFKVHPDSIMY